LSSGSAVTGRQSVARDEGHRHPGGGECGGGVNIREAARPGRP